MDRRKRRIRFIKYFLIYYFGGAIVLAIVMALTRPALCSISSSLPCPTLSGEIFNPSFWFFWVPFWPIVTIGLILTVIWTKFIPQAENVFVIRDYIVDVTLSISEINPIYISFPVFVTLWFYLKKRQPEYSMIRRTAYSIFSTIPIIIIIKILLFIISFTILSIFYSGYQVVY